MVSGLDQKFHEKLVPEQQTDRQDRKTDKKYRDEFQKQSGLSLQIS